MATTKLTDYRVRDGFYLHLVGGGIHPPGTELKLSPEQAKLHAHQIELVTKAKKPPDSTE